MKWLENTRMYGLLNYFWMKIYYLLCVIKLSLRIISALLPVILRFFFCLIVYTVFLCQLSESTYGMVVYNSPSIDAWFLYIPLLLMEIISNKEILHGFLHSRFDLHVIHLLFVRVIAPELWLLKYTKKKSWFPYLLLTVKHINYIVIKFISISQAIINSQHWYCAHKIQMNWHVD